VDVARLAGAFGGGGHRNAAGCTIRDGLAAAKAQVLAAAEALWA
jgi:nanoRNase/pAp phosphatase (c-di-AMP/oligoRNAs hydrolase)